MPHLLTFGDLSLFLLLPSILSIGFGFRYVMIEQLFNLKMTHQLFFFASINSLSKMSMFFINKISKKRERKTNQPLFRSNKGAHQTVKSK